jgi:tetratricopeptide (TPR) repeat protein
VTHRASLSGPDPEVRAQYQSAQKRFDQHIAELKAAGKSAEAAKLEVSIRNSAASPGESERLDEALNKAMEAMQAQRVDEAGKHYQTAVDLARKLQPPDDRLTSALLALASIYGMKNDLPHAESAMQEALKAAESLHGPDSPAMTMPLQMMASRGGHAAPHPPVHRVGIPFDQPNQAHNQFKEPTDGCGPPPFYLAFKAEQFAPRRRKQSCDRSDKVCPHGCPLHRV